MFRGQDRDYGEICSTNKWHGSQAICLYGGLLTFQKILSPLRLSFLASRYEWSSECQAGFVKIKGRLTTALTLAHYDHTMAAKLRTDASILELVAIMYQMHAAKWFVVAYASRSLVDAETRYAITELEAFAVVRALKKWREYLYGLTEVIVEIDHHYVCLLRTSGNLLGRPARWAMTLADFSSILAYTSGKQDTDVDALSRAPRAPEEDEHVVCAITSADISTRRRPVLSEN